VTFGEIGLPDGTQVQQLIYCALTGHMVAHLEVQNASFQVGRLYAKRTTDVLYSSAVYAEPNETLEYPHLCPISGNLYFLSSIRDADGGGWIKGVFCKDLKNGRVRALVQYLAGLEKDSWVASLHGVSGDGRTLFCSAAFATDEQGGARRYDYFLSALDVSTSVLSPIAPLRATFA
jgi:hypothetical protein